MEDRKPTNRRALLKAATGALLAGALPRTLLAQNAAPAREERHFDPRAGDWKSYEVVTRVNLQRADGPSTIWIPLPSVDTDWQRTLSNNWSGNAKSMKVGSDPHYGARFLMAEFDGSAPPVLEVVSRIQTRDRAENWKSPKLAGESADDLRLWMQPTDLLPLDGIVRKTALQITSGARTDEDKVQRIYDWIVLNTFREPKVKGCGTGDIKTMLETGNLGGKCADLNALYVGLARAVGLPARDVYGVRVAKSQFGYRSLGAGTENITRAQHCRAEVFLDAYGWVPVDPADVRKVVLEEKAQPVTVDDPLVQAVRPKLFGAWEMNWLAFNTANDIALPNSKYAKLTFLMYPQAETAAGRLDSLDPDNFRYTMTAKELAA